nr:hypothetical protein [Tanacetum cinerariifolium]
MPRTQYSAAGQFGGVTTLEVKEPESEVHVSPSSSAKTRKHDDKTKREAKGKSPVELSTGVRNLSKEFEDFSSNSTNGVNAASTPVTVVEPNSTNSTNTFIVDGPSNNVVTLEDITYSDDEEDVGAKTDFSNLETNITVTPQTRSMTRMVKDQGGLTQINNEDFHTCFMLYQMDIKSAFLYGTIKEEVYICQPLGFEDLDYHDKVYKVVKVLYGLHQAPRVWSMWMTSFLDLPIKTCKEDGILVSQDKYVAKILRKFGLTDRKSASTPIDTEKPILKDPDGDDVDVHTYRSMIGSLMYLTSSIPDIMFSVCACASFQVTPKASHLHVQEDFWVSQGQATLGLWYPKDSPFNLVAYSDSDYAGTSLDRVYNKRSSIPRL